MNAILTISTFVFPIITFPYASRILLPAGTGRVSFAISFVSYFVLFSQLGIPTYGIRACARVRDDKEKLTKTAQELLIINLVMSLISYIALAIAIMVIPRLQNDRTLFIVVSSNIILNAIGMEWIYKALEQYTYITIRSLIFKVLSVIALFLLVHEQSDYILYAVMTIIAGSASYILNFINVRKFISLKPVGNYNFKVHLKAVMVFFAMACATTIYTNLDTVMLGFMKTNVDVGYYNAAVKIKNILLGLVTSLSAVLLPRVSYYVEKGLMDEFKNICRKALNFAVLVAIPFSVYFIYFAKYAIFFLSGEDFAGAILPMQIIMTTVFFIGITNILGIQILVPLGEEKKVLYSVVVGAVVDLILNFIFIPIMGASGAALGTLVAEAAVLVFQLIVLWDRIKQSIFSIQYWKILLGNVAGMAASFWVAFIGLGNFVTLLISAILYFGVYYIFLMITKEKLTIEVTKQVIGIIKSKLKHA